MNLLDKASIILTPTAYNNGEALCVKPSDGTGDFDFSRNSAATRVNAQGLVEDVQILSSNLVQNGDFSQLGSEEVSNGSFTNGETDWTLGTGWSVGEDKAVCSGHTSHTSLTQSNSFVGGKTYKISFDIIVDSGNFAIKLLGGGSDTGNTISSTQIGYTEYITPSANRTLFSIRSNDGNGIGSITNISVKEVGQNWYLGTGWEIGNNVAISDTTASNLTPSTTLVSGEKYKFTLDVAKITSGNFAFLLRFNGTNTTIATINTEGSFTFYATADATGFRLQNLSGGTADFSVTNITAVQITDDTNLPRINYEGFSYQDALGSELVLNGGFDTDTAWSKGSGWSIADGTATHTGGASYLSQSILEPNKQYKVKIKVIQASGSNFVQIYMGNSPASVLIQNVGEYEYIFTSQSLQNLGFALRGAGDIEIDNVSVKEYSGQEVVPDSGCGSWLWEPQSTNLITYSEDFSQSYWAYVNVTKSLSAVLSPNGVDFAYRIENDAVSGNHFVRDNVTVLSGTTYTSSVFIKKGTRDIVSIGDGNSVNILANFNLTNGTVTNISATSSSIESYGNDWFRCTTTITTTTTLLGVMLFSGTLYAGKDESGDFYIWGAQVEQQSYSTSYIPTDGTQKTRNQDVCTNGGSVSTINSTEGVLYAEIAINILQPNSYIQLSDGTYNNRVAFINSSLTNWRVFYRVGGVSQIDSSAIGLDVFEMNKLAISWKLNEFKFFVNGVKVGEVNSGVVNGANTFNQINFSDISNTNPFFGKTKCLAVWKEALTDTELQELTTI